MPTTAFRPERKKHILKNLARTGIISVPAKFFFDFIFKSYFAAATLLMVVLTVMPVNTLAVFVRPVCAGIGISTGQFTVVSSLSAAGAMVTSFFGRLIKAFGNA